MLGAALHRFRVDASRSVDNRRGFRIEHGQDGAIGLAASVWQL